MTRSLVNLFSWNDRQLLLSGGFSLFFRGAGALGLLVLTIAVNRLLPPKEAGLFFVGQTILTLIAGFGLLGFDTAALRFVSIESSRKGYLYQTARLALPALLLFAGLTAAGFWGYAYSRGREIPGAVWLLIPAAGGLGLNMLQSQGLFAMHRVCSGTIMQTAFIPWGTLLLLLATLSLPIESRLASTAFCYTVAAVLSALVGFMLLRPAAGKASDSLPYREILNCSFPLMVISLSNLVLASTDKLLLTYFNSTALVAPYEAARQSVRVGELLLVSCNSIVAPRFAAMWDAGAFDELKALLHKSTLLLFSLSIPLFVFFLIFGKFLMQLNNPKFIVDSPVIWILAAGQCVVLGTGPVAHFLMMTGKERWHRNNVIGCIFGNILLGCLLIPRYGIIGATLSTTATLIVKNLITCGQAFYVLKNLPTGKEKKS